MEFVLTHPDTGIKSILVLFDGVPYEADSDHPWWDEIVDLVLDDDPRVLDLFPIRPVQQPSTEVEVGPEPDEETAAKALLEAFGDRDLDEGELTEDDLKTIRTIFDEAGFGTCDDPDCTYCYGDRVPDEPSPWAFAPDQQAFAEVGAHLNRVRLDALAPADSRELEAAYETVRVRGEEIEELVSERDDYATRLMARTEDYEVACELLGWWQHRALLFESAIRTYAEHIWNDLKRVAGSS
jgi:hypothetical protein